jgi:hypothetical protein
VRRGLAFAATGAVAAVFLLVLERALLGVALGSDAYSYIVWGRDAVAHGTTHHSPFDYTVPKPFDLLVAVVGKLVGAPLAVFGWWTVVGQLAAVAAAAMLAYRFAGRTAAWAAGVLALALPVLWRGGPAGDSNVPYAALVVAAASLEPASLASAGLLGLAGLLRPEAWGLAVIAAALGWRDAPGRERLAALGSIVLPPIVWLGSDRLLTGDALWSEHVLDRYDARFHPPHIAISQLPSTLLHRVDTTLGWPLLVFALIALVVSFRRRVEPAAVFAVALALLLVVQSGRHAVSTDDLGRMLTVFGLLGAAGGAALLASLPNRLAVAAAVVLCLAFVAFPVRDALRAAHRQGRTASRLEHVVGPAIARRHPTGPIAVDRAWQGAVALYSGLPRRRFVPLEAVGHELSACAAVTRVHVHPPRATLAYRSCTS